MIRLSLALALIVSAAPAQAGDRPLTQRERDDRIAGCIRTHGTEWSDRCVEIMESPSVLGRRARQGYEWRRWDDEIERRDICQDDDPRIIRPRACFSAPE
jgi:hypothetical protein